ncbi:hypothetical protein [Advenella mimigardefordensis]
MQRYRELAAEATSKDWSFLDYLEQSLASERDLRQVRSRQTNAFLNDRFIVISSHLALIRVFLTSFPVFPGQDLINPHLRNWISY